MANDNIIQRWLEQVSEDISSAECLFSGGHWLYVGFLCHQAIEKSLKAYYIAAYNDDPPYTHSHIRLLNACGLSDDISEEHMRFIGLMGPMYIEARYPEQKRAAAKMLNEAACRHIINLTKEITQWIEQRLPNNKQ